MKLGVSSHSDRTWTWLASSQGSDTEGDKKKVPYDGNLTKYDGKGKWWDGYDPQDLYTRPHTNNEAPDKAYQQKWYLRTKELIDKYQPDLLWFDGPMPMVCNSPACDSARQSQQKYGLDISSYYYNQNQKWHNGKLEAVLNLKEWKTGDIPNINAVVLDIEKGQTKEILKNYWQTDTSISGDWFFDSKPAELSDIVIIHNLCDIVSKNGNLLLNVGLRADGSLPDDQLQILLNIGKWLDVNGEAIYGTRPWTVYGEGPTQLAKGDFQQNKKPLTAEDIRYTTKNNKLYAIVMGIPQNGQITLTSLPINHSSWFGNIVNIKMLGTNEKITWTQNHKGLTLNFPKRMTKKQLAYVFEIGNK